jgi:hypothetical protein
MMRSTAVVMAVMSMMVGACVDEDVEIDADADEAEVVFKTPPDPEKCPLTGCKYNKVHVGAWIHEVATTATGLPAQLTSFTVAGEPVSVSYNDVVGPNGEVADGALRRGRMTISVNGQPYTVLIRGYQRVDFVMSGDDRALFLDLQRVMPDNTLRPICNSSLMTGDPYPAPANYVAMFTGDRYNLQTGVVSMPGTGVVTLACAGSPMARMHLERLTTAGARGSLFQPSLATRQRRFSQLLFSAPPVDPTL